MEKATRRGSLTKRPLEEIPAFQNHLRREGIALAEFERRQRVTTAGPDVTSAALDLARRKLKLTSA